MTERELRDSLLRGEDPIDVRAMTERVLRRDRRRMWLLGGACVLAWMLVVMLPWATILPMLAKVVEHQATLTKPGGPAAAEPRQDLTPVLQAVKQGTIATFVGSIASMLVAALSTVALVILSRRATLRQVNARLAEISAQLRAIATPR
jgi:hypothetical protein